MTDSIPPSWQDVAERWFKAYEEAKAELERVRARAESAEAVDLAEMGRHIRDSALEEAARVAEGWRTWVDGAPSVARSIRALKSTPQRLYSVEEVERALRVAYPVAREGAQPGWWPVFRAALEGKC